MSDAGAQEVLRAFGQRVRDLRTSAEMTQEHLADASGLHRTYVGSLERGERNVSVINLYVLARALAFQPGDLLP